VIQRFAARSWELRQVFDDLRREQEKVPNIHNRVFTRPGGRPIKDTRTAWHFAVAQAVKAKQLPDDDLVPHDLRCAAISRFEALGIPHSGVQRIVGHKPANVHERYIRFSDAQLVEVFRAAGLLLLPPKRSGNSPTWRKRRFKMPLKRKSGHAIVAGERRVSY
jgi:integrase